MPTGLSHSPSGPALKNPVKAIEAAPIRSITLSNPPPFQKKQTPFERLSEAELQSQRQNGLYYYCDKKFSMGHKCKSKELKLLVVDNEEWEEEMVID